MIVAVTGGKGGVGKSTMSLNLGRELDAVVVDADLTTADLPRGRGPDLHDVLMGRASPMEAVEEINSIKLLPCGRTLEGARAADLEYLSKTLDILDRQYGRVIVDCPAGMAQDVGTELRSADLSVLVTNPTETALLDAVRTRNLSIELDTPVASIVLNKVTSNVPGAVGERVESTLGAPVTSVPKSEIVARSGRTSMPLRELDSSAAALDPITSVAERLERCEKRVGDTIQA